MGSFRWFGHDPSYPVVGRSPVLRPAVQWAQTVNSVRVCGKGGLTKVIHQQKWILLWRFTLNFTETFYLIIDIYLIIFAWIAYRYPKYIYPFTIVLYSIFKSIFVDIQNIDIYIIQKYSCAQNSIHIYILNIHVQLFSF